MDITASLEKIDDFYHGRDLQMSALSNPSWESHTDLVKGDIKRFICIEDFYIKAILALFKGYESLFETKKYISQALFRPLTPDQLIEKRGIHGHHKKEVDAFTDTSRIKNALLLYDEWNNVEVVWESASKYYGYFWSTSA